MKYYQLSAFDAVTRAGGIRAAAKMLGITQGAVTKAVRELEKEVGESLIVRSAQGVSLTNSGRQLALRSQLIVNQMKAAQDDILQLRNGAGGRLRIGITPTFIETILPKIVTRFRERMPGVHLGIVEAAVPGALSDIRDGTLDLAVVGGGAEFAGGADLSVEALISVSKKVVVRRGHPYESAHSVRDLAGATWILPQEPSDINDPMFSFFSEAGLPLPSNIVECATLHATVTIVANSEMVSALPDLMLGQPHIGSRLVPLDLVEQLRPSQYWLVRRAGVPLSPAAVVMTDLLHRFSKTIEERRR